jgi:hypothetical protein
LLQQELLGWVSQVQYHSLRTGRMLLFVVATKNGLMLQSQQWVMGALA